MDAITFKNTRELFLKKRSPNSHKGDYGRILIIAGSQGMMGAAILCAKAALRTGSGLVTISAPEELIPIAQIGIPEATCIARDINKELSADALAKYDAIAIGPGIGTDGHTEEMMHHVLEVYAGPLVLDADALNILANFPRPLENRFVITPHPGEAARLLDTSTEIIESDREAAHVTLEKKYTCVVVLKGSSTLVTPQHVNTTGNAGMATGGSGDVLTGIITSLIGQKISTERAARAGVYIHGLAGDLMADELCENSLIASDIIEGIPKAIKLLSKQTQTSKKDPQSADIWPHG